MSGYVPLKDRLGSKGTRRAMIAAIIVAAIVVPACVYGVFVCCPDLLEGAL